MIWAMISAAHGGQRAGGRAECGQRAVPAGSAERVWPGPASGDARGAGRNDCGRFGGAIGGAAAAGQRAGAERQRMGGLRREQEQERRNRQPAEEKVWENRVRRVQGHGGGRDARGPVVLRGVQPPVGGCKHVSRESFHHKVDGLT